LETTSLKYNEQDNDWAKNIEDNPIHISQAISGAKGYYCMGCDKEMQAVKRKNIHYKSYFRHHVKDVDTSKVECVHASRVYREKLAFFYFQRTKKITVPDVYKYPPRGIEGDPMLVQEKETIIAHKVEREVTFFEDEFGKIHRAKNTNVDDRFLWVRPDAVFFDKDDNPILFIEFVITHKPDTDKLNKLQRLGINTVQIIIPKLSEEQLEKEISKVSKIKWVYNEIESNTEYIRIQSGNSEGIPQIDEEQRKLFEESYSCRATQLGNLVRAINRCLASQSYKRTEQLFEQEIQRIEEATRKHRSRLDDIQEGIEREIHSELESRREDIESRRGKLEENGLDLEKRYFKRRQEITDEQADTDREIGLRHRIGKSEEDIRREFESEEARIDSELSRIKREQGYVVDEIQSESRFEENFEGDKLRIEDEERQLEQEFAELERQEREGFESLRKKFQSDEGTNGEFTKFTIEERIRSEFERKDQQVVERINNRDIQSNDELSERIKAILELRGLLDKYNDVRETLERYQKGRTIIKNGTYKEWDK
jgi:hypothetical protein